VTSFYDSARMQEEHLRRDSTTDEGSSVSGSHQGDVTRVDFRIDHREVRGAWEGSGRRSARAHRFFFSLSRT
jgi:hypothetical protein